MFSSVALSEGVVLGQGIFFFFSLPSKKTTTTDGARARVVVLRVLKILTRV
jgi:hypothetical protein